MIVTPAIAAALDRTKVSDRNATFVLASTTQALGVDSKELTISRQTVRQESHCRLSQGCILPRRATIYKLEWQDDDRYNRKRGR